MRVYQHEETCKNNCYEDLGREGVSFIGQKDCRILAVKVALGWRNEVFIDGEQEAEDWIEREDCKH